MEEPKADETVAIPSSPAEATPAEVADARAEVKAAAGDGFLSRAEAERILARLDRLEHDHARLTEESSRYAKSDHAHPHDPGVQTLIDALNEQDAAEQKPERRRWWHKKIGGR